MSVVIHNLQRSIRLNVQRLERDELEPGQALPEIPEPDRRLLGDLMLGIPYIHKHSQLHEEQLEETLSVMVLHGMCHLIGYDHETEDQWKQMYHKELRILEQFNQKTGYSCKPLLGIGHG
ncbi:endoribonuclease YbeY-like isoform X2 [Pecten maximus]|uniref:endoribonuclease YbeY-like isoform X2 n=1 Tax=Pecten maximus TaxID=6579 RepID=UPI0014580F5E|nr:endoribonuclease YbeY-like isoform X2 [Pecten maximus]